MESIIKTIYHFNNNLHIKSDVTFEEGLTYAVEVSPDGSRSDAILSGSRVLLQVGTLSLTLENQQQPLSPSKYLKLVLNFSG